MNNTETKVTRFAAGNYIVKTQGQTYRVIKDKKTRIWRVYWSGALNPRCTTRTKREAVNMCEAHAESYNAQEAKIKKNIEEDRVAYYRGEYKSIRARAVNSTDVEVTTQQFDAAVRALLQDTIAEGVEPRPESWVHAAKRVSFRCRRCAGTGKFITHVENGKPCGPGGHCFRCQATGRVNDADQRRNYGYDLHRAV